jgi:hypothetical protein
LTAPSQRQRLPTAAYSYIPNAALRKSRRHEEQLSNRQRYLVRVVRKATRARLVLSSTFGLHSQESFCWLGQISTNLNSMIVPSTCAGRDARHPLFARVNAASMNWIPHQCRAG